MEENQNTNNMLKGIKEGIEKAAKEEVKGKVKKHIIAFIIAHIVPILIYMSIFIVAFILFSAIIKYLKINDGSYKEGNYKNVDYVVSETVTNKVSASDITGNESSGYKLNIDLDAKVDEILKTLEAAQENNNFDGDLTNISMPGDGKGTKIETYLSEEHRKEYLKDFIKAELITQYPDLRNNPDALLPEGELQGVIKIRRAMSDGSKKTLRYVDEETFNSYIDRYNRNGDATAVDYFTLNSSGDLVVAKWNKTTNRLDLKNSGDSSPDSRNPSTKEEYKPGVQYVFNMTKVSINYRAMVEKYSMPFDFLWALLAMTEDEEFAHNLSKLALNSEIEFTVNDNKTTVTTTEVYTYKKQTKNVTTVNTIITAQIGGSSVSKNYEKVQTKINDPIDYTITKTIVEEDTNPIIDLTSANTWIAKYKNIYVNQIEDERKETKDTIKIDDTDYEKTSERILTKDKNSQEEMLSDDFVKECLDAEKEDMKNNKRNEIIEKEIENLLNQKIAEKRDASIQSDIFYNVINQVRQNILTNINENKYSDELFRTWNISNRIDSYKGKLISERTAGITNDQTIKAIKESVNSIKNDDVINMMKEVINVVNSIDRDEAVNRNIQSEVKEVKYEYYRKTTNQEINTTITINSNRYIQGTPTIEEKLDKEATEENFVTLFNKSPKAINTLESTPDWVCEMLESSPKTADMVDLFKYIMYKASNKSYGVETFDFNEYNPNIMNSVGNGIVSITGNTVQQKVWNALVSAGFSDYAAAGAMGNINGESGFNPNAEEGPYPQGYGLCQWSYERRTNYEAFAASKGKDVSDANTQIEFFLGDLGVEGFVTKYNENMKAHRYSASDRGWTNAPDNNKYGYDDWVNAKSAEEASKIYQIWYEGPASYHSEREEWAKTYYETYEGIKPEIANSSGIYTGNVTYTNSGSGLGYSRTVQSSGKTYKVYDQTSFSGKIPSSGCSITSESIVLSGYRPELAYTPENMAKYCGYSYPRSLNQIASDLTTLGVASTAYSISGSTTQIAEINITFKKQAINNINTNLKEGKPVIILVTDSRVYANKYTRAAHYMVLTGFNNVGKPVIADPYGSRIWEEDSVEDLVNYFIYEPSPSGAERGYVLINKK